MLTLIDASPDQLHAIAAFLDDPNHGFKPLIEAGVTPVLEWGDKKPDRLIGFEKAEAKDAS